MWMRSQNRGESSGVCPRAGTGTAGSVSCLFLLMLDSKYIKKNQVSQGFRAKKTWKLGIIQKECHSCFSSSASPTSVLTGILLCLQLCYQHWGAADNTRLINLGCKPVTTQPQTPLHPRTWSRHPLGIHTVFCRFISVIFTLFSGILRSYFQRFHFFSPRFETN